MNRCDFSSVITIIKKYISDDYNINQSDLLDELFHSFFYKDDEIIEFDFGLICRWFNGLAKISPRISEFYLLKQNKKKLVKDIENNILPVMYDSAMCVNEIYDLLVQDSTISDKMKRELTRYYPCKNIGVEATFIAYVLSFGMERTFVKRNNKKQLSMGTLSPILKDFVFNTDVPKPCKYFCGRDNELDKLHDLLQKNNKVFLQGIAGIGKSELAKAYAKKYSKEYTNIIYITYTGDLMRDIADMDFVDDISNDNEKERFQKHNRFLRILKEDTLIIIDNFNVTSTDDSLLSVVLKYRCRVLFTTRSRFENHVYIDLEEISDKQDLLNLIDGFYSDTQRNINIIYEIIDIVHSHTLAVELVGRLLETGILEPKQLLEKLKQEKASLSATDTIGIVKDGENYKATYYDHIHTLFSLYKLSIEEQDIMRSLSVIPTNGINSRLFAKWLGLNDLNTINYLIEKGFVKSGRIISLHPMIMEVTVSETKPSINNLNRLLSSLQNICLEHGKDISYYKLLFHIIENVINIAEKDDKEYYLRLIEDVFAYMQKYNYQSGMQLILKEMEELLQDYKIGKTSDRALLFDYKASNEKQTEKAIKLEKNAVNMITEITNENALLLSNIYANLGGLYRQKGQNQTAKKYMEQGIYLLEQYGFSYSNDSVVQIINYAVLLSDMGNRDIALSALQKLIRLFRENKLENTSDYAIIQETMARIYLISGEIDMATNCFKKAMAIYSVIYEQEPDFIDGKKQEILETYKEAGFYLANQFFK